MRLHSCSHWKLEPSSSGNVQFGWIYGTIFIREPTFNVAIVRPFRALRPKPGLAAQIASVPYDVISTPEARCLAEGQPLSFLRIVRSELELPDTVKYNAPQVYALAKQNLQRFISDGVFFQEDSPVFYLYRLVMGSHQQTGFAVLSSVDEYDAALVRKHENTRHDKEEDRRVHIETLEAQAEPVFLTYRANGPLDGIAARVAAGEPLYDFTSIDGIRHTVWKAPDTAAIEEAFRAVPMTYIADGHHRCASASLVRKSLQAKNPSHTGKEAYIYFLSVLFPDDQLQILPYNRIIRKSPLSSRQVLDAIGQKMKLTNSEDGNPSAEGEVRMYLDSAWYSLKLPENAHADAIDKLDVSRLQKLVLEPVFGIADPRSDKNIDFIGGIRGTKELVKLVDGKEAFCAFSLYPVSQQSLLDVADAGGIMPPKSTWFEPKLRSGLFLNMFRASSASPYELLS